jgi:hypothetical protein
LRSEPPSSSSDEAYDASDAVASLAAASQNPLSLNPSEVIQYRLAGLDLDKEIPAVHDFPHRGIKPAKRKYGIRRRETRKAETPLIKVWDEDDHEKIAGAGYGLGGVSEDVNEDELALRTGSGRTARLRMQHFAVLTAILHKCLMEGDIPRASRAWAMLIRAQFGGIGVDIRSTGYWGIGAELLLRANDPVPNQEEDGRKSPDEESTQDMNKEEGGNLDEEDNKKRWGTAEGWENAKEYYEQLILQYPYTRQYHSSISALDFWPAMVGCEVYGIQWKQKEALRNINTAEDNDDGTTDSEGNDIYGAEDLDSEAYNKKRMARLRLKRLEKRWQEREEIRTTALEASEQIALRMDGIMTTPPYSDSHTLLRLRAMIALYIGDLSIPVLIDSDVGIDDLEESWRKTRRGAVQDTRERQMLQNQRLEDHQAGIRRQAEEQARAKDLFRKIVREGGWLGGTFKESFLDHDNEREEEGDKSSEEGGRDGVESDDKVGDYHHEANDAESEDERFNVMEED